MCPSYEEKADFLGFGELVRGTRDNFFYICPAYIVPHTVRMSREIILIPVFPV